FDFLLFQADAGITASIVADQVLAGIFVEFAFAVGFQIGVDGGLRLGEVVVVLGDLADAHFLGAAQREYDIHVLPESRGGVVGGLGLTGAIHESAGLVGKNQRVLVLGVFEEIENAFVFEQAGDKIEIGFAILDAIFAGLVAAGHPVFVIG